MAHYFNVSLEHHSNRRYHVINRGRRPEVAYGKFNLRFRCEGKRIRLLLESADLTAALQARNDQGRGTERCPHR